MRLNSLAFRLFATAIVSTMLILPVAGLLIYSVYRQEAEEGFDERLRQLLTIVHADSIDESSSEPGTPGQVGEPLFFITHSGWYWQIKPLNGAPGQTKASPSLANFVLPSPFEEGIEPDVQGTRWLDVLGPNNQPVRIAETIYAFGEDSSGPQYSIAVAGPLDWLEARVASFGTQLAFALTLAGIALVAVTLLQVRFGLLPLRAIENGLAAVRSGKSTRLEGELPAEIEPLQHELNALIQSNEEVIERARTQVGNLAHALKTPLAVITNEAREDKSPLAQKVAEQAQVMRDQVNHYLDRARMAASAGSLVRVTDVLPVAEALQRALERIYHEKGIAIRLDCPEDARFQGERHDLEEMLGNLLDNACKWGRRSIRVSISVRRPELRGASPRLIVTIEDDGPGLTEDQRRRIGKRGLRLDETKPGSGLGLSIVSDLALSYRGRLELGASRYGGLLAKLDLPAA
ncbi:MAG TPA: sensor histidine kinase [Hyphomicrobiaceae bacterium]|jgi:signal transduction histidine kinase